MAENMTSQVRVRFAPSPTGFLHVGGLRTALFNFLLAHKNGGTFVLRIEDTDKSREVQGAVDDIIQTLEAFKLNFDEGPIYQSKRLEIYRDHAQRLVDAGHAYKCFCTPARIADLKKQAEAQKAPFKYDKHCLKNPPDSAIKGSFVIRQNIREEGEVTYEDLVHGKVTIQNRLLDDGVLIKSDGFPVYNFANVVDDHLMNITHVIRGEEFLSSTPKHILLYRAFGWLEPQFAHLPLLLDSKRRKLSKRAGDVAVRDYLKGGYLPEALLNFVAFLGWNPKTAQEIFSLDELISAFDLKQINKAGAIFDLAKLQWFNRHYLKMKPIVELLELAKPFWPRLFSNNYPENFRQKVLGIERERLTTLAELKNRGEYFWEELEYDPELLRWKQMSGKAIKEALVRAKAVISGGLSNNTQEIEKKFLNEIGAGDKGEILWPLRAALTGLKASPGPFEILGALLSLPNGKEIITQRIDKAIDKSEKL